MKLRTFSHGSRLRFWVAALAALPVAGAAQFSPPGHALSPGERLELTRGRDRLGRGLARLREAGRTRHLLDAEIFFEAVDRNLRQDLFFSAAQVQQAQRCLQEGEARVAALERGEAPWERETGYLTLGYRSAVDGSVQPYQVYVPPALDPAHPARLDLFLHGRGGNLNELTFLSSTAWATSAFGTAALPHLTLYPYGRGNNGWRFAGERDVFEALADVRARFKVDPEQVTLRGFSMGGHGTWHIGLQHPELWAVMSPGAGFTDTKQYQNITETFPDWQERLLHLYDPVDYAANGRNLPILAYCGELDPARPQHDLIAARLRAEETLFYEHIGAKTGHTYEPATRDKMLRSFSFINRASLMEEVIFVTYTLRWPECKWVRIEGLQRHWDRAEVRARVISEAEVRVSTRNISDVTLKAPLPGEQFAHGAALEPRPRAFQMDGQRIIVQKSVPGLPVRFRREASGRWRRTDTAAAGLRKKPGLQGPIDDALFGPVVAVRGTGTPWSEPQDRWLRQELQRFRDGWDQYYRAHLPEVVDTASVTQLRGKNLYLFGDPSSNRVLARLLPKLPLRWKRDSLEIAGKRFSTRDHLPMLVFPNPEDLEHYVVLNTGFTFSRADWNGSNALQYPHLPDYAVIRIDPDRFSDDRRKDAVLAGFFDERWRIRRMRDEG